MKDGTTHEPALFSLLRRQKTKPQDREVYELGEDDIVTNGAEPALTVVPTAAPTALRLDTIDPEILERYNLTTNSTDASDVPSMPTPAKEPWDADWMNKRIRIGGDSKISFEQHETTIAVTTSARKYVECSFCDANQRLSLVQNDARKDECKSGASRVCRVKKEFRCEKLCFVIGKRGRILRGEKPWTQGFTEKYCPVDSVVKQSPIDGHDPTVEKAMSVTADAVLRTRVNQRVLGKVTLEDAQIGTRHAPYDVRMKIMSDRYGSEDDDLRLCCFPGCSLPSRAPDGSVFPWYWNDVSTAAEAEKGAGLTLQESASIQAAYTF